MTGSYDALACEFNEREDEPGDPDGDHRVEEGDQPIEAARGPHHGRAYSHL